MDKTLRHQIGQMIIAGFPSLQADDQARLLANEYQVGNFILFARNMKTARQTAELCAQLSQLAYDANGLAPFIAADQEGGLVARINEGAAMFPGAMALAAAASAEDARQVGKNCGEMLRAMGVNVNFAPVLDVNIEPLNPIIGNRSFGDQPQAVADLGCAVAEGLVESGVIATVKHYPGHGNVATDSHLALPPNNTDPELLAQTEFLPFQQAFDRGVPALMSCHIRFPKIDPELPATLSPAILTDLLRKKQGFKGLVFTDCMEMDAIRANWGTARGAVLAVAAGCDVLCISHHAEAVRDAIEAIEQAVESGELPRSRIQESYDRIVAAKQKMGLTVPQAVCPDRADATVHTPHMVELHKELSRRSITLISGSADLVQKAASVRILAPVSLSSSGVEDKERDGLSFACQVGRQLNAKWQETPMNPTDEEITAICAAVQPGETVVLGLYNARFREGQVKLLRALEALDNDLAVMLMGGPYDASLVRNAGLVAVAYEYSQLSALSAATALSSGTFFGTLPITL